MFAEYQGIHRHWVSACQQFADNNKGKVADIARSIGMNPQTLRNKLNAEQEHELTVAELIAITIATEGDETLFDGALLCCRLTAIAIPDVERAPSLPHQAIGLNAAVASIGQRALELTERGHITRSERNTLVSVATSAMGSLAILIHDVEQRFQVMSPLAALAM
ncbi:MAG: phage regulatory CII family protein [Aeromonas popoffii]|uniref:phage regulatory CII family protein n=1 Tax=Aeromonas popoffii TaxID=70856 RepID=UPI003F349EF0